ncbi:malonic semialdehyde reductase [Oceanobacillus picturae]|uniref:Malonic semialdehyde reductase n=1 Tax=Oceanobacillus picturae TaxID=171693 RepID=A0A0U9H7B6_9BACI|nr:nitroreductase family protein [Oceanobacillus picturae]AVQ99774.1 NADH dehydrogenase [Oceanobacillus iheyensis]GAQ18581.1 malonic semialdehyde reductase [Oceanobacillus picturae]
MTDVNQFRKTRYDIDPIYIKRWSPRSFSNQKVSEEVLSSVFEAARWAPSAANVQPWRFVFASSEQDKETFLSFINEGNVIWCKNAPVLIAVISKMEEERFGGNNPAHAFDTGTAWGFLSLEAARKGLITHAMGGFNKEKAKEALSIPDGYQVHAIVALGYQGEKSSLEEAYQKREVPSPRNEVETFVSEGVFRENM